MARTTKRDNPLTLVQAAEAMLVALHEAGRLEVVDAMRVAALRGLVLAVSEDPTNAALWRELRAAEATLRAVGDDVDGGELAALFASLGDSSDP